MAVTKITEIRILPPLAVGRLGSSPNPMDNYDFQGFVPAEDDPSNPATGYRKLVPAQTYVVDRATGAITADVVPAGAPQFRDAKHLIRPICPFLEVWALVEGNDNLVPLTLDLLTQAKLTPADVVWNVEAVNSKAYRRTGVVEDKVISPGKDFSDHAVKPLIGTCANFYPGKSIPFGDVQYIQPTAKYPEIRLRFTPAPGKVYGPKKDPATGSVDGVYNVGNPQATWKGYYYGEKPGQPLPTKPDGIFYGETDPKSGEYVSLGYFDDMCDGMVKVSIKGTKLSTFSRISVGPPDFAPDSLPVRAVSDELKQIDQGPDLNGNVTAAEAEDIIRRALETVRLLNAYAMNGNPLDVNGEPIEWNSADPTHAIANHNTNNMVVQNFRDTGGITKQDPSDPTAPIVPKPGAGRAWSPLFDPPNGRQINNSRVTAAHRRLLNQVLNGEELFGRVKQLLRKYDEVGDYTDEGRQQMPGLMRNADGMLMALTRHMQSLLSAATDGYAEPDEPQPAGQINPKNRTAQIEHRSTGNPPGTLLTTAVSNNFPGLEFDYRSIWHHVFVGVTMYEAGAQVTAVDPKGPAAAQKIKAGMLMIMADDMSLWADVQGPLQEDSSKKQKLSTQPLEWSNAIASIVHDASLNPGHKIECIFVDEPPDKDGNGEPGYTREKLFAQPRTKAILEVRQMFATNLGEGNGVFGTEIASAGDLTQGLCSPWQNDYRECSCYYWAAARPDFVNRHSEDGAGGEITGDNWLQNVYNGHYLVDDRTPKQFPKVTKFVSYVDLFKAWEQKLHFVIQGQTEVKDMKPNA